MTKDTIKNKFSKFVKTKIRSFEEFGDDFSNVLYLINDTYLVRDAASIKDPLVSFKNEKSILQKILDLDVTEKILHYSPTNGFKIARLVKVSKVFYEVNEASILEFVRTLKKIQKVESQEITIFDPRKALTLYKKHCFKEDLVDYLEEEKILKCLLSDKLNKVVSHCLIEKQKVKFFENKVKLVDFRYTCMNSPLFDLAYFSNSFGLTEKQNNYLLSKYFGYRLIPKYKKLFVYYKKYINLLRYYRNCYFYALSGEITYLDTKNELKKEFFNI